MLSAEYIANDASPQELVNEYRNAIMDYVRSITEEDKTAMRDYALILQAEIVIRLTYGKH